jgi:hypothetical protein
MQLQPGQREGVGHGDRDKEQPVTPPEDQKARLRCFRNALRNWKFRGYVRFKPRVEEWLKKELPELTLLEIARELHLYVEGGGEIDEQEERRPEWDDYEFHHDLRVPIGGRRIYFETLLFCEDADDPDDPVIEVVSVHDV